MKQGQEAIEFHLLPKPYMHSSLPQTLLTSKVFDNLKVGLSKNLFILWFVLEVHVVKGQVVIKIAGKLLDLLEYNNGGVIETKTVLKLPDKSCLTVWLPV